MRKYIDEQMAVDAIANCRDITPHDRILAVDIVDALPPANVREVVFGTWINEPGKIPKCSVCGIYSNDADEGYDSFCPNCGTEMRRNEDE